MANTVCTGNAELPALNATFLYAVLKPSHQGTTLQAKFCFQCGSCLPLGSDLLPVLLNRKRLNPPGNVGSWLAGAMLH